MSLKNIFSDTSEGKTVFILGAGFSKAAGYPLQAEILHNLQLQESYVNTFMDTPSSVLNTLPFVREYSNELKKFLAEVFHGVDTPTLEDIFTTLDQTIFEKGYCKGYEWQELIKIDTSLKASILFSFHRALSYANEGTLENYRNFSAHLLNCRLFNKRKFSVISLNWDSLLEDSIYWCIREKKLEKKFDVDYCCFTNSIGQNSSHTPSITQKAKGIKNIKILKLHGSSSWLICYSCKRLFTGIGSTEEAVNLYNGKRKCPNCLNTLEAASAKKVPELKPFIITPTYLKTFPNSHIQNVWDNAQIELLESDRVVFLGYSLPEADYFVRSLFRRTINKNAKIDVVLLGRDPKYDDIVNRYKGFFPKKNLSFYKSGMDGFFKTSMDVSLNSRLKKLR